jgi:outer membrane protein assembly factor BamB
MIKTWCALAVLAGALSANAEPLIDDTSLEAAGMSRFWEAKLPLAAGDRLVEGHLIDEALYVITDNGTLFSVLADVGLIRWAKKLAEPDYKIYRPTHIRVAAGNGAAIVPTTSWIYVIDRFSGDLLKQFAPGFGAGSSAVAYEGLMFIGSAGGRFYCLLINDPRSVEPFKFWEVETGGPITASPVLFGRDTLIFASQTGTAYSCRAPDKALYWSFRTGGRITGTPAVDESGAYIASTDRSLYKVSHGSGRLLWRVRMPQPLEEGPIVVGQTLYQYCPHYGVVALDTESGTEKWRIPDGRAFVAHASRGDTIFTTDRRLVIADPETGEVRHSIAAPEVEATVPNPFHDAVVLLGEDGRVLCARLGKVPYLRRQQVIAARKRLNLPPIDEAAALKRAREESGAVGEREARATADPLRSKFDRKP